MNDNEMEEALTNRFKQIIYFDVSAKIRMYKFG